MGTFTPDNIANSTMVEDQVLATIAKLPATKDLLKQYSQTESGDRICGQLMLYCQQGWPERHQNKGVLLCYWSVHSELTSCDGLLLYGSRIAVPKSLQHETLSKIHQGHQGIEKYRLHISTFKYGGQE